MNSLAPAKKIIQKSQIIFIVPEQKIQPDILGAGLGLFHSLKKIGKNVNLFLKEIPQEFQFLPPPSNFANSNSFLKDFIISINNPQTEISRIYYEKSQNNLRFYLTPKTGALEEKNVFFSAEKSKPDLLITLGIKNWEDLEKSCNPGLNIFQGIPILNIDNQITNENFGEINLIEITNISLAEITTRLIKSFNNNLPDKDVVTWLLAGIIWASQNFRNQRTHPKTLETAAYLIEQGADHQKIIHYFHKSKPLSYLKLLAQIFKKISFDSKKELAWVFLTSEDFKNSKANSLDLALAIKELKTGLFRLPALLVLWEESFSPVFIKGVFYSNNLKLRKKILRNFEGISKGQGTLFLIRTSDFDSAQKKVLQALNQ
ncbi:hypothetical protein AMJ49_03680 [Parcubacteria bacterium DG_74_2]|nr:MAG: hypothetical protein AMJ49_03680 [Parcubacteria bacterium DG_74_2]